MRKGAPSIDQVKVLIRIRKATGLTQQEFADKLGVERAMIANIERGAVQQPRLSLLPLLVEKLGVDPYCLVRENEPLFLSEITSTDTGKDLRREYENLISEMREKIAELSAMAARLSHPANLSNSRKAVQKPAKASQKPS